MSLQRPLLSPQRNLLCYESSCLILTELRPNCTFAIPPISMMIRTVYRIIFVIQIDQKNAAKGFIFQHKLIIFMLNYSCAIINFGRSLIFHCCHNLNGLVQSNWYFINMEQRLFISKPIRGCRQWTKIT